MLYKQLKTQIKQQRNNRARYSNRNQNPHARDMVLQALFYYATPLFFLKKLGGSPRGLRPVEDLLQGGVRRLSVCRRGASAFFFQEIAISALVSSPRFKSRPQCSPGCSCGPQIPSYATKIAELTQKSRFPETDEKKLKGDARHHTTDTRLSS